MVQLPLCTALVAATCLSGLATTTALPTEFARDAGKFINIPPGLALQQPGNPGLNTVDNRGGAGVAASAMLEQTLTQVANGLANNKRDRDELVAWAQSFKNPGAVILPPNAVPYLRDPHDHGHDATVGGVPITIPRGNSVDGFVGLDVALAGPGQMLTTDTFSLVDSKAANSPARFADYYGRHHQEDFGSRATDSFRPNYRRQTATQATTFVMPPLAQPTADYIWGGLMDFNLPKMGIQSKNDVKYTPGFRVSMPDQDFYATGMGPYNLTAADYTYIYVPYNIQNEIQHANLTGAGDYVRVWMRSVTNSPMNVTLTASSTIFNADGTVQSRQRSQWPPVTVTSTWNSYLFNKGAATSANGLKVVNWNYVNTFSLNIIGGKQPVGTVFPIVNGELHVARITITNRTSTVWANRNGDFPGQEYAVTPAPTRVRVPGHLNFLFTNKSVEGPLPLATPVQTTFAAPNAATYGPQSTGAGAVCVYLTSTTTGKWRFLVEKLATFGIPHRVVVHSGSTTLTNCLQNDMVIFYPSTPSVASITNLATTLNTYINVSRNRAIAFGSIDPSLFSLFGVKAGTVATTATYTKMVLSEPTGYFGNEFTHPNERTLPVSAKAAKWVSYVANAASNVVARYTSATATTVAILKGDSGRTMLFGVDAPIIDAFCSGQDGCYSPGVAGYPSRYYSNGYEPGTDLFYRMVRWFYETKPVFVSMSSVPFAKDLTFIMTHDIDGQESFARSNQWAAIEQSYGVPATYNMQTRYHIDAYDNGYMYMFQSEIKNLTTLFPLVEVGSHSISHSPNLQDTGSYTVGTGKEMYTYPARQETYNVQIFGDRTVGFTTTNLTILGETRVSKHLIDQVTSILKSPTQKPVISFRAGHLCYPKELPQALEASGYKYMSNTAAGNIFTNMPVFPNYNLDSTKDMSKILDVPIGYDDTGDVLFNAQLAGDAYTTSLSLAKYGGIMMILSHPTNDIARNTSDADKVAFFTTLYPKIQPFTYATNLRTFGDFWLARRQVTMSYTYNSLTTPKQVTVSMSVPSPVQGLTLRVPATWPTAAASYTLSAGVFVQVARAGRLVLGSVRDAVTGQVSGAVQGSITLTILLP